LVGVLIWALGTLIAMTVIIPGVTPASILAVLGLGSVAVGFAFKDIFENFLAGALLMLRKRTRLGDVIDCEQIEAGWKRSACATHTCACSTTSW